MILCLSRTGEVFGEPCSTAFEFIYCMLFWVSGMFSSEIVGMYSPFLFDSSCDDDAIKSEVPGSFLKPGVHDLEFRQGDWSSSFIFSSDLLLIRERLRSSCEFSIASIL